MISTTDLTSPLVGLHWFYGQSSKDMSECSSDQLDQSVRIGSCFICEREWLAREKQLAGSIVLLVGFWRLLLSPYDSVLVQPKT